MCNIPRPVYQLGEKGRLEVLQEKDNFTQVISSFCIDNLQKEDGGPVAEVIVTDPGDCLDVVSFSEHVMIPVCSVYIKINLSDLFTIVSSTLSRKKEIKI